MVFPVMKIVFINPPNAPPTSSALLIEPIDTLSLATYVRSLGHDVSFLDMDARRLTPVDLTPRLAGAGFDAAVIIFDHHIPLYTDEALSGVLAAAASAAAAGLKVVVGGKAATYEPERFVYPGSPVTVAARRELEPVLRDLFALPDWTAKGLRTIRGVAFLDGGLVQTTPPPAGLFDLDAQPVADRRLAAAGGYIDVRSVLTSRGCPNRCRFCHVPGYWGRWRGMSPQRVLDELEQLTAAGAKKIIFLDDNATADPARMRAIADGIRERGLNAAFGCLGSVNVFDGPTFELMAEAGFRWVHFGAETGDAALLRRINKNIGPDQVARTIDAVRDLGLRVRTSWILDLPGADAASFDRSLELMLRTGPEEIRLHFLALRYGSEYFGAYREKIGAAPQYVHGSRPQLALSTLGRAGLEAKTKEVIDALAGAGYLIVTDPEVFADLERRYAGRTPPKIAALCPIRYGLFW